MKIYVKASSEKYRSYEAVSEALVKLFGFGYEKFKKKSDWFESEWGTVRYDVVGAINDSTSYNLRIFFDPSDFDENRFKNLLTFCKDNSLRISSQHVKGLSNYDRKEPQINIRVAKRFAYTHEQIKDICKFVESYINNLTGETYARCECGAFKGHWGAVAGTERVDLRVEYYRYDSVGPNGDINNAESWAKDSSQIIDQVNSTIADQILSNFPYVKKCTIEPWGIGFNIILKF